MKKPVLTSLIMSLGFAWSCCPLWDSCGGGDTITIPVVAEATIDGVHWDGYHGGWVQEEGTPEVAKLGDYLIALGSPTADGIAFAFVLRTSDLPTAGRYDISTPSYDPDSITDIFHLADVLYSEDDVVRGYLTFTDYANDNEVTPYLGVQGFIQLDSVYLDPYGSEQTVVDASFEMNVVDANNQKICIEHGKLELFTLYHYQ